jgi:hypothetical protein
LPFLTVEGEVVVIEVGMVVALVTNWPGDALSDEVHHVQGCSG